MAEPLTDQDLAELEAFWRTREPYWARLAVQRLVAQLRESRGQSTALAVRLQEQWANVEALEAKVEQLEADMALAEDRLSGAAEAEPAVRPPQGERDDGRRVCPRSFASEPAGHVDPAEAEGWGVCRTCGEVLNIGGKHVPEHFTSASALEADDG